ncbi:MAG: multicopper oxidase family protein, partial [Myxococcales bacterium]|nr:multicopper oxidase family protein [Myxococcales bacterium]
EIYTRTYAGSIPGPTLRLQQGDMIDLDLINSLPVNPDEDDVITNHNWPHHINSTNFHLHGFHADPTGDGDNSLREVFPQTTALVSLDVPDNHNPGSHWYHGHKHGSLAVQFYGGMSGMIVIEGDVDEVPEIAAADEKVMIIQELGLNDDGEVPDPDTDAMNPADLFDITQTYYPINGKVNPIIRMQPGEVQRWRLLNSTLAVILNLELEGHDLHPIAADGITYDAIDQVPTLGMAPGDRADILVQAGAAGTYQLVSPGPPMSPDIVLATIIVEGDSVSMDLPGDLPEPDYILPDAQNETPDDTRQITFEMTMGPGGGFTISGQPYDPSCVNYILQRGDVVDWEITNNAGMGAHPFHIHTNSFQVLEVNGVPENPPRWHDVYAVPGNGGTILARMRVDDFVGGILLHCHIVTHEELGMMHKVVIVDDTIPDNQKVPKDDVDLSDPATANPSIPGYYVTENFDLCQ